MCLLLPVVIRFLWFKFQETRLFNLPHSAGIEFLLTRFLMGYAATRITCHSALLLKVPILHGWYFGSLGTSRRNHRFSNCQCVTCKLIESLFSRFPRGNGATRDLSSHFRWICLREYILVLIWGCSNLSISFSTRV